MWVIFINYLKLIIIINIIMIIKKFINKYKMKKYKLNDNKISKY